jgi:hypothetical protein
LQHRAVTASKNSSVPPIVHEVLHSSGQPLDASTRDFMESRFDHDFSRVRVHTDAKAAESAQAVNALAYTVRHNVVFGASEYAPASSRGRELLGHELAHTIQQRNAGDAPLTAHSNDVLESSAEAAGRDVSSGRSVSRDLPSCGIGLSRTPDEEREAAVKEAEAFLASVEKEEKEEEERAAGSQKKPSKFSPGGFTDNDIDEAAGKTKDKAKLAATPPVGNKTKEDRRNRTIRYYRNKPDEKLEAAYRSRLKLYLEDRLQGQKHWDLEAQEEIIKERAPNAPWHEDARQEFLAQLEEQKRAEVRQERLQQLPEKVRGQFQQLGKKTKGWAREEQDLAQELLWRWIEYYDQGLGSPASTDRIRKELVAHYETWLRAADRAIQQDCKRRPRLASLGDKIRRNLENAQGDPCKPWFEESHQYGYSELHQLESFMRVTTVYEKPEFKMYLNIHTWVEEFRGRTNPEAILAKMRGQGVIGIGTGGFGGLGARIFNGLPKVAPKPTPMSPKQPIGYKLPNASPPAPTPAATSPKRTIGFQSQNPPTPTPTPATSTPKQPIGYKLQNTSPPVPTPTVTSPKPRIGFQSQNTPPPTSTPAATSPKRRIGFQSQNAPPPAPVSTDVPSRVSPPTAGFGRDTKPAPAGSVPQDSPVITQMPPARVVPTSQGDGSTPVVTGQRRNQPAQATVGKNPPIDESTQSKTPGKPATDIEPPKTSRPAKASTAQKAKAQSVKEDPQRGVKEALKRTDQRLAKGRKEVDAYNKRIEKAREKVRSLLEKKNNAPKDDPGLGKVLDDLQAARNQLDELTEQRDHQVGLNQEHQATAARLQQALDTKTYDRPTDFWAGVREKVWQNALKEGKGKVLSPSKTQIKEGDSWVMGHKEKYEFRKHQKSAAERGISREEFIKEHNDPKHYRPETKADNESHLYEDKTDAYLGH